jgi:hypothetical protein
MIGDFKKVAIFALSKFHWGRLLRQGRVPLGKITPLGTITSPGKIISLGVLK